VILVGDTGVGKTHILSRYIKNALPKNKYPTIGVEFATKAVPLKAGGTVKAQIWDTAGQERFRAITSAHYRKSIGALIVYDITVLQSFESVQKWIDEVKEHAEPDIVIMLVGNKLDLCEQAPQSRQVSREMASSFAKQQNLLFMEASAIQDYNVRDCFETLVQEIYTVQNS
jgi:small GTP-binding protein